MSKGIFSGSEISTCYQVEAFLLVLGFNINIPATKNAACLPCCKCTSSWEQLPWLASPRYSLLLTGRTTCSQHNPQKPERPKQENSVFTSSEIHMANVPHSFNVSPGKFEGILDIHVAYVLSYIIQQGVFVTQREDIFLFSLSSCSLPYSVRRAGPAAWGSKSCISHEETQLGQMCTSFPTQSNQCAAVGSGGIHPFLPPHPLPWKQVPTSFATSVPVTSCIPTCVSFLLLIPVNLKSTPFSPHCSYTICSI